MSDKPGSSTDATPSEAIRQPPPGTLARLRARWTHLDLRTIRPSQCLLITRFALDKMRERGESPEQVFGALPVFAIEGKEGPWLLLDREEPGRTVFAKLAWRQRPGDPPGLATEVYLAVAEGG